VGVSMRVELSDLLQQIAHTLNPDDIIDRLNISSLELVETFADQIAENLEVFDDISFEEDDDI
jgi:hypothetical protein